MLRDMLVLDFTKGYCGAFATSALAVQGAKVHKIIIEDNKDFLLNLGIKAEGSSTRFMAYNGNKEVVIVDKGQEEGLNSLIKNADVIVVNENINKGFISYEKVKEMNPNVVFANISALGENYQKMPYAESSAFVQALAGIVDMTGFPEKAPVMPGANMIENFCGLSLSVAIVTAYYNKLMNNTGENIKFSMYNTVFSIMESPILFSELQNLDVSRCGNGDYGTLVPYDVYECKDGYFSAGLAGETGWDRFCEAIGKPELIEDERFITNEKRCENYKEATAIISEFCLTKTRNELVKVFTTKDIPNSPVLSIGETMQVGQVNDREMVVPLPNGWLVPGNPVKSV
ncbi:CoA transferase [Anaerotignum sp.]|uniref:CoA transferase n=1 Tax=Anaerotignum sp. TaxID=2039241 RepID=UPI0028B08D14|nr:CoA transferase [Anaerotignum sp.]